MPRTIGNHRNKPNNSKSIASNGYNMPRLASHLVSVTLIFLIVAFVFDSSGSRANIHSSRCFKSQYFTASKSINLKTKPKRHNKIANEFFSSSFFGRFASRLLHLFNFFRLSNRIIRMYWWTSEMCCSTVCALNHDYIVRFTVCAWHFLLQKRSKLEN